MRRDCLLCGQPLGFIYRAVPVSGAESYVHPPVAICGTCDFTPKGGPPVPHSRIRNHP